MEPHFSGVWNGRVDFSAVGVVDAEGYTGTFEQDFKEDLGVEGERGRVEGDGLENHIC